MTVWKTQNKRRPGAYINVIGKGNTQLNAEIGRTLLPINTQLNWGAKGIIKLNAESNFLATLGHDINDSELQTLREVLKGANTVLLLNNNDGEKALVNDETLPWVFTAKYPGTIGNNLHVSVEKKDDQVTVSTLFNTKMVDQQMISTSRPEDLMANDYVDVKLTDRKAPDAPNTPADSGSTKDTNKTSIVG